MSKRARKRKRRAKGSIGTGIDPAWSMGIDPAWGTATVIGTVAVEATKPVSPSGWKDLWTPPTYDPLSDIQAAQEMMVEAVQPAASVTLAEAIAFLQQLVAWSGLDVMQTIAVVQNQSAMAAALTAIGGSGIDTPHPKLLTLLKLAHDPTSGFDAIVDQHFDYAWSRSLIPQESRDAVIGMAHDIATTEPSDGSDTPFVPNISADLVEIVREIADVTNTSHAEILIGLQQVESALARVWIPALSDRVGVATWLARTDVRSRVYAAFETATSAAPAAPTFALQGLGWGNLACPAGLHVGDLVRVTLAHEVYPIGYGDPGEYASPNGVISRISEDGMTCDVQQVSTLGSVSMLDVPATDKQPQHEWYVKDGTLHVTTSNTSGWPATFNEGGPLHAGATAANAAAIITPLSAAQTSDDVFIETSPTSHFHQVKVGDYVWKDVEQGYTPQAIEGQFAWGIVVSIDTPTPWKTIVRVRPLHAQRAARSRVPFPTTQAWGGMIEIDGATHDIMVSVCDGVLTLTIDERGIVCQRDETIALTVTRIEPKHAKWTGRGVRFVELSDD